MLAPWRKSYDLSRQHIKKQRHYFSNKHPSSQSYAFPSRHAWIWELNYEESWVPKNWCFWTVLLEKTLESPLDCKKIQPVRKSVLNIQWKDWCWKLKLQYFGHLMQSANSLEKILRPGKIEGKRIKGQQRIRWLYSITNSMHTNLNENSWRY